ncbi:A-kinase anchor protein 7-like [Penaeus monodon]|uniref:A-kinase anchor protein 7-like n=1 Tax=Penaeus monodon TaxID=6687 RepID=UPI0018A75DF4|nr:A-kinase anchor protein 7-like [Penaeus monodon]
MDDSDKKDADEIIIDGEEESESLLSQSKRKQEQGNKVAISPPSKKSKLENGSSEEGQEEGVTEEGDPSSLIILEDDTVDFRKGRLLAEYSVTADEEESSLDSITGDTIAQNVENGKVIGNITTTETLKGRETSPLTETEELDLPVELKKKTDGVDRVAETLHELSSCAETEEIAPQEESEVLRRQFTEEVVLPKESDILKNLCEGEVDEGVARPLTTKEEEKLGLSGLFEDKNLEISLTEGLDNNKEETVFNQDNAICVETHSKADIGPDQPVAEETAKQKKKKGKRRERKRATEGTEAGAARKDLRPNYFVGVKISNAEIHQAIVKIQEDLIAFEPKFARALIDVATSHITLLVAHIDSEEKLSLAISALDECKKKLTDFTTKPIQLTFSGVGHFSNQVVYAKLVEDEHYHRLLTLATEVRQVFSSMGVCMPDVKDLHPHLTIAKTSKAPHRKGKHFPRKFDPASYQPHQDAHFGCQYVFGLQLLSMNKPKDKERYYHCEKEMSFGKYGIPSES